MCHHIKHLKDDDYYNPKLSLNFDNLECLYWSCHNKEHGVKWKLKQKKSIQREYTFNEKGELILNLQETKDKLA